MSTRFILLLFVALSVTVKIYLSLDGYLHEWDERYHALVAKHLADHPLKPTLYEKQIHPFDSNDWTSNEIWLSKPPIPLWFIAVSIKLFGNHEWAVRIPGILFATLSIILVYLIVLNLLGTKPALIAAFLTSVHGLISDLASGRLSSDGVESCFLFFVLVGCYFVFRKKRASLLYADYMLIGLFTGIAVMCKWQPGFIVLVLCFVFHFKPETIKQHLTGCFIAFASSTVIILPWVIFILYQYPIEAKSMLTSLLNPMFDKAFSPDGTWYSYLTDFGNFFGYSTYAIIIFLLVKSYKSVEHNKKILLFWILLPLLLFSFAEAKRGTYLFISYCAVFAIIGWAVAQPIRSVGLKMKLIPLLGYVSVISVLIYSVEKLYLFRKREWTKPWSEEIKNKTFDSGAIIYDEPHYIEMMFYHDVIAYPYPKPK